MPATILKEVEGEPIFKTNPNYSEFYVMLGIIGSVLYGFILMPLKGYLFTHVWTNILLTGSSISQLFSGAEFTKDKHYLILGIFLGSLSALKFTVFYWGAGKRFGRYYIDEVVKNLPTVRRIINRFEGFMNKHTFLTIAIVNIPFFPVSNNLLALFFGEGGVRLRKYLTYTYIVVVVRSMLWFSLGYVFGKPVLEVVQLIDKYVFYITLALMFVIFGRAYVTYRKSKNKAGVAAKNME